MHYINVIVSKTATIPGKIIRLFTHSFYNHTSFSLDDNFETLYTFARKRANTPLIGGFLKEKPAYLSLGKNREIYIKVFRIPISNYKYKRIIKKIKEIEKDDEYLYNLLSVAVYPLHLSFSTYKAYNCTEFVVDILKNMNIVKIPKKSYKCSPKDLCNILDDYLWYEGKISDLVKYNIDLKDEFFSKGRTILNIVGTIIMIKTLFFRKLINKQKDYSKSE